MMDDALLIETVRNRREIYDKSHAGFKNPAIKECAWSAVAEAVHASVADCTARWNTLRERYAKEKRLLETETRSEAGASKRPVWTHWYTMNFLNPQMRQRKSVDNLTQSSYSASCVQLPLQSPTESTSSIDEEMATLLSDSTEASIELNDPSTESAPWQITKNPQYTVIASCPPISSISAGTGIASTKSAAASLPYFGSSHRSKKPKPDDIAEMFKETLANLNKSMAAPAQTSQAAQSLDADSLIGQTVTACLQNLIDAKLKLRFRKKFRDIVQECEEVMIEDS